jgi:hypothetical protein
MSEMVERVARALCRSAALGDPGQAYIDANWPNYSTAARAAIEAMREPTEAMIGAGRGALPNFCPEDSDALVCWQDMIDAALA